MKNKKNTNPKILILTQINPINVAYVYDEICNDFLQNNDVFSPQIMALLGELSLKKDAEDFKHSYRVLNAAFVKNIKAALQKMSPFKPWIVIGNCAKTNTKFDYVIGFDGGEDYGNAEVFDRYIKADNESLLQANMQIDYYKPEDAEIIFSAMSHLKLFLTTIGCKKGQTINDTV